MTLATLLAAIPDDGVIECGDPFDPNNPINPECFPEPPGWLMPLTFTLTGLLVAVVVVMIVLARISRKRSREYMAAKGPVEWIDLNELAGRPTPRQPSAEAAREQAARKQSGRAGQGQAGKRKRGGSAGGKP